MPIEQGQEAWTIAFIPAEDNLRAHLSMLAEPHTGQGLVWRKAEPYEGVSAFLETRDGVRRYPVDEGIVSFLEGESLNGPDRWARWGYDLFAGVYDRWLAWYEKHHGGPNTLRPAMLSTIPVEPGQTVLETSVGTGMNFWYLPPEADYVGIDISRGMLKRAQANLGQWRREALLLQANADALPFRDEVFDVVYHVGGFNFFTHQQQAMNEMIRVAKPGGRIVVEDELLKAVGWGRFFRGLAERVRPPVELVPPGMQDVRVQELWNGRLYSLSFRKPH